MPLGGGATLDERSVNAGVKNAFELYPLISAAALVSCTRSYQTLAEMEWKEKTPESKGAWRNFHTPGNKVRVTAHARHVGATQRGGTAEVRDEKAASTEAPTSEAVESNKTRWGRKKKKKKEHDQLLNWVKAADFATALQIKENQI